MNQDTPQAATHPGNSGEQDQNPPSLHGADVYPARHPIIKAGAEKAS